MTTKETAIVTADERTTARVVESMVLRGDISALSPEERARFYLQMCESLGLSAASQPLAVLRLNGKEILYPTRGATDQLAAIHRLNREIVDGPRVIDVAGTKMIYAVCRATHPNGRTETAVSTVPLADPINALMKCETKAKRRATLSILGLGMLDETEIETIPASVSRTHVAPPTGAELANAKGDRTHATSDAEYHAERPVLEPAPPHREDEPPPEVSADHPAVRALLDALEQTTTPEGVVLAWLEHSEGLVSQGSGVLHKARELATEAWTGYGGADGYKGLRAAVIAAREAVEGKPAPSPEPAPKARKRAANAAPLRVALDCPTPAEWAARLESATKPGHVAGGYHKRAAAWREAGTLAAIRGLTVQRVASLLQCDDDEAARFVDGCQPRRR